MATRLQCLSFALIAFATELSLAVAQDNPPRVPSESIMPVLFPSDETRMVLTDAPSGAIAVPAGSIPIPLSAQAAVPAVEPAPVAMALAIGMPPHVGVPASCSPPPTGLESTSTAALSVATQPTPLSPTDSKLFAESTTPASTAVPNHDGPPSLRQTAATPPRMPKMTKMFSFDTTDKVGSQPIAAALAQIDPELTLNLDGPNSVAVNQVFQQLVQVHNSSNAPLRDVRVTQVCDLAVLGAQRHQAITIDRLDPGETKTIRFSARSRQVGKFSVRYVAENARIQADIDDQVDVGEVGASVDINASR